MSSSEHSPIMTLPYEILVKIFCYLDVKDLLSLTQFVCTMWKDLSHDLRVWKHRTYIPYRNENILETLGTMPSLQHLVLNYVVLDNILDSIPDQCHQLRVFKYCDEPSCDFLTKLKSHCPHLEELSVSTVKDSLLEKIGKLPNLKRLKIKVKGSLALKSIADGCPSLISLKLCRIDTVDPADFAYFLDKKKHQLVALCLSCWPLGECALPYLKVCKKLKELELQCDCVGPTRYKGGLSLLRSMKTVVSLSLCFPTDGAFFECATVDRSAVMNLFANKGMCQLEEIRIANLSGCDDIVMCTIVQNCPLLKKVSLIRMTLQVESCLHHLEALPFLEFLTLIYTRVSENVWQYIRNCAKLSHLDLTGSLRKQCSQYRQALPELNNLRILILNYCNLIQFPFDEISLKFPKLEFLSVRNCILDNLEPVRSLNRQKNQLEVEYDLG